MWYLIGAIISSIASLGCIISTTVEYVKGKIDLKGGNFWGAVVFHLITGVLAVWLASKYLGH